MKPEILIVEDELITAEAIASDLEKHGFTVREKCQTGELALKSVENELPDLVLMDIRLRGGLDGIEVAERILKKYRVPIIYLTDLKDDRTPQQANLTAPSSYLTKPLQTNQLIMAVELALFNGLLPYMGNKFSFFKAKDHTVKKVVYEDILYLKSEQGCCEVSTKKDKFILTQTLRTVHKKIPYPELIRVSRSYCVNTNYIDKFLGNTIFIGEKKITIGETYREDTKRVFNII